MTVTLLPKLLFAVLASLGIVFVVFSKFDSESEQESERQKYTPYLPAMLLPVVLVVLIALSLPEYGVKGTAESIIAVIFGVFLHISAYYLLLMLLMPLLRRFISSRACAMLWIIPSYLYLTQYGFMVTPAPKWIIRAPERIVWIIAAVWLAGFLGVLVWKIAEHLIFRKKILKNAKEVTDERILEIWNKELDAAYEKKPKYKLVISPDTSSPLSIGFFKRTTKVVLPRKEYSNEELSLIFRHEIVHLSREDSSSKFFLVFCTALCWFNPLMWMAMKKSAEDIELSCDETVLLKADEETRYEYAELLLKNAGSTKGFTTCLSASANSLRYRLKAVTKPKKMRTGAVIVGLTFFGLIMSYGYVALAYGDTTGTDILYKSGDMSEYHLISVRLTDDGYDTEYYYPDEGEFHEFLANMEMIKISGNYAFSENNRRYTLVFATPEGTLGAVLIDNYIQLRPLYNIPGEKEEQTYYLPQGVDWKRFDELVSARPALNVYLNESDDSRRNKISASLISLSEGSTVVYDNKAEAEDPNGIFGGAYPKNARLSFSHELASECTVTIEPWNGAQSYTITLDGTSDNLTFDMPDYAAHYIITASLYGSDGVVYDAEYRFDIGDT